MDFIDVVSECERNHIRIKTVHPPPRLFVGSAVRLFECDILSGLLLPFLGKCLVEVLVEFAGRVIRNVQKLLGKGGKRKRGADPGKQYRRDYVVF